MSDSVNQLDEVALARYLETNVEGFKGPLKATKFDGGQSNPTFKIEAASGDYVLRRQPPGKLLKSAHAVDREYRVLDALKDTDVPVAKVYHLCEDREVIGSMFYIMEFCAGRIFWDSALPELQKNERAAYYDEMNRVLAAMHNVKVEDVGLGDYGKPGNYFERQFTRWSSQYRASEMGTIDSMESLMEWLQVNLPADDGQVSLVHGDFRLDNMMFHPTEPKVIAVLDWELSTLGHPCADLAYQCMGLKMPPEGGGMRGLGGLDLDELGIPSEADYVAKYCERRGLDQLDNWTFYLAFSFFRLAAIVQGVAKRAADGNASNKNGAKMAAFVKPLADMAMYTISQDTQ